ncbi:MAG: hypothetical protein JXA67_09245 [Micromonosporaceae bacterium]|nr:hypothetical protein [Micromonosporaceae bacterium]
MTFDAYGSSGRDVDHAFALVDAAEARQALRSDPTARLAVVLSDSFHSALAEAGDTAASVAEQRFAPMPIVTKQGQRPAWVCVPRNAPARIGPFCSASIPWQIMVGLPEGPVCGPGILFPDRTVLTCVHTIPGGGAAPRGVAVGFAGASGTGAGTLSPLGAGAQLVGWTPTTDGLTRVSAGGNRHGLPIAVLRLHQPVPFGARPATPARCGSPDPGRRVTVAGPRPWLAEVVGADDATGWGVRLRPVPGQWYDGCCFAGNAVLGETSDGVIGIVVEVETWGGMPRVVMVPTEAIAHHLPDLSWDLGSSDGGGADQVTVLDFGIKLSSLPIMETEARRNEIVKSLRPDIGAVVARHSERRLDVVSMVRTCLNYPQGLEELLRIVQALEGDSRHMHRVVNLLPRLDLES